MNFKELMALIGEVLKNPRVILITVFAVFFIALTNWVINYRKKPPKVRRVHASVPSSKPEESDQEEESEEEE